MTASRQVIALCSVGNLGKYICDELLTDNRYDIVVISRQVSAKPTKMMFMKSLIGLRSVPNEELFSKSEISMFARAITLRSQCFKS